MAVVAVVAVGAGVVVARATHGDYDGDVIHLDQPGEYVDPSGTNPPQVGEVMPAFRLTDAEGAAVTLVSDGRPMVVNLWQSTCPHCTRELPAFAAVDDEYGDRVRVVGINDLDSPDTMKSFAAERGVHYELLMDPDYQVQDEMHVVAYPATWFVAADGEIVAQTLSLDAAELRRHVEALLS